MTVMPKPEIIVSLLRLCVVVFIFRLRFPICNADIGSAGQWWPPYTPTACFDNDLSQFPTNRFFAAAGEDIWNNAAACGRQYLVQCISSVLPLACLPNQTIHVRIVDRALTSVSRPQVGGASLVLSRTAFAAIADPGVPFVNIQFVQ